MSQNVHYFWYDTYIFARGQHYDCLLICLFSLALSCLNKPKSVRSIKTISAVQDKEIDVHICSGNLQWKPRYQRQQESRPSAEELALFKLPHIGILLIIFSYMSSSICS